MLIMQFSFKPCNDPQVSQNKLFAEIFILERNYLKKVVHKGEKVNKTMKSA